MLDEGEWAIIAPELTKRLESIKQYREAHNCDIAEAAAALHDNACQKYNEVTGFKETNANAIYHHRNSLLGPDCPSCGKPYRTPAARYCVACGHGMESIQNHPL